MVNADSGVRMASSAPTRKMQSVGVSFALTTILVWALNTYAHADIPTEVGMAIQGIIAFAVGYFVPPSRQDVVVEA